MDFLECLEKIKQAHRNYAKRQLTWFKRVRGLRWISAADPSKLDKIMELFNHQ
jgi:tRNA dimethylallyltransferase